MAKIDSPLSSGPDFQLETRLLAAGKTVVAGVDEVGRGPLAGPVVVAAVVLDPDRLPLGLNDSKKLTPARREVLAGMIFASAAVAIASVPPALIDRLNIRGATLWAMRKAVLGLPVAPAHILVDGRDVPPGLPCPADALIKGDGRSLSIAAASIVAKVMRDRMCPVMDKTASGYDFAVHKGYGTKAHREAIARLGPGPDHRRSFAPVKQMHLFED